MYCVSLRRYAEWIKSDSKSAEGNLVGVRPPLPAPSKIPISFVESEACRARLCAVRCALGIFWVDAALRYEFRYSAHPLSFQYLGPFEADFISADYPYLRQITECAADSTISFLIVHGAEDKAIPIEDAHKASSWTPQE
jgi:hypothetical protein